MAKKMNQNEKDYAIRRLRQMVAEKLPTCSACSGGISDVEKELESHVRAGKSIKLKSTNEIISRIKSKVAANHYCVSLGLSELVEIPTEMKKRQDDYAKLVAAYKAAQTKYEPVLQKAIDSIQLGECGSELLALFATDLEAIK